MPPRHSISFSADSSSDCSSNSSSSKVHLLFLASLILYVFGNVVAILVLFWWYPALFWVIVFASSYLAVISAAFSMFLYSLHLAYDKREMLSVVKKLAPRGGIETYFPSFAKKAFRSTIFEIATSGHSTFIVPLLDVARLLILVSTSLTDEEKHKLLKEMPQEFRYAVFEHQLFDVMPEFVQRLLRGRRYKDKEDEEAMPIVIERRTMEIQEASRKISAEDEASLGHESRKDSIRDHLEIIEKAERPATYGGVMEEILADKASEMSVTGTARFMLKSTEAIHGMKLKDLAETWQKLEKNITTQPQSWIRFIPWEIARITLKVGGRLGGRIVGWALPDDVSDGRESSSARSQDSDEQAVAGGLSQEALSSESDPVVADVTIAATCERLEETSGHDREGSVPNDE